MTESPAPAPLLLSISKLIIPIPPRYFPGHVLTAPEALALNQTFIENVRNNQAPKVKKTLEAGEPSEDAKAKLIAEIQAYAQTYEFSATRQSRVVRDPVEAEARKIALNALLASLQKKGKSSKDFTKEALDTAVDNLLKNSSKYLDLAKQRLAELQQITESSLEDLL